MKEIDTESGLKLLKLIGVAIIIIVAAVVLRLF